MLVHVDMEQLRAEEDRLLKKKQLEHAQRGVGVSAEAQAIFDSLAKTMPCRWQGASIVILDTVTLSPPYTPANLRYEYCMFCGVALA